MENFGEQLANEMEARMERLLYNALSSLKQQEEYAPGLDLSQYISATKAAEQLGISRQTLWSHKSDIGYRKCFGQIFFNKQSLIDFIESGKPVVETKKIMRTRRALA